MPFRFELRGVKAVNRQLDRLGDDLENLDLSKAAKILAKESRRLAPVRTGRMRRSVRARGGGVYSAVPYTPYVHWGTSRITANPFVIQALSDKRVLFKIMSEVAEQVQDKIDERF